jgi:hypothetical protein
VAVHTYNPRIWKAETGGSQIQVQPGLKEGREKKGTKIVMIRDLK